MNHNIVIGIEGYVGAGKTSICKELLNRFQILFYYMMVIYIEQLYMQL